MNLINNVTADTFQKSQLILPDGSQASLSLAFFPMQFGWFLSLSYKTVTIDLRRIFVSPNILHQFCNQLPFGIACTSSQANREPTQQQDFSSGNCNLYLLTAAEVAAYTRYLAGG